MSSRFRRRTAAPAVCALAALCGLSLAGCSPDPDPPQPESSKAQRRVLRVCSDPNNLPFSNARAEGFENELANLIAHEMKADVEYYWWAQRRGFIRNTLREGKCDVVIGMPTSLELALVTTPYYRSTYVFVTREDRKLRIASLDDPQLRSLKIGVHIGGDDGEATPPGLALARRGITHNVKGYSVYGDYRNPNPPEQLVRAVATDEIDVAIVWGPLGGYFASREAAALSVQPVTPEIDLPFVPMVYDISLGVRRSTPELRDELESILQRRRADVDAILEKYGVPRADVEQGSRT